MDDRIKVRLAKALDASSAPWLTRSYRGAAVGTNVGRTRPRNEDCCLVSHVSYGIKASIGNFIVAVVCDGLGGMNQGREASIRAASSFVASLFNSSLSDWMEKIKEAIDVANADVYGVLRGGGGTTLSSIIIPKTGPKLLCHVGDSRIYGIEADRTLKQLSRDDTMNALLNRRDGVLNPTKDSRLLQFVGMGDEMEPQIDFIPDSFRSLLLTSDGAHDLPHEVLQRVVSAASGGNDLVKKLLSLADMTGGYDNASAIFMQLDGETYLYDDVIETEIQTLLPHDTLSICIMSSDKGGQQIQRCNKEADNVQSQKTVTLNAARNQEKSRAVPPKDKIKSKKRQTRRKIISRECLPLDDPNDEIKVQFSGETEK